MFIHINGIVKLFCYEVRVPCQRGLCHEVRGVPPHPRVMKQRVSCQRGLCYEARVFCQKGLWHEASVSCWRGLCHEVRVFLVELVGEAFGDAWEALDE